MPIIQKYRYLHLKAPKKKQKIELLRRGNMQKGYRRVTSGLFTYNYTHSDGTCFLFDPDHDHYIIPPDERIYYQWLPYKKTWIEKLDGFDIVRFVKRSIVFFRLSLLALLLLVMYLIVSSALN